MSSEARMRMAQVLATPQLMAARSPQELQMAGNPGAYDSRGLQAPAVDPIMLGATMATSAAPSIARALAGASEAAPRYLASEAGALFPEGTIPFENREALKELGSMVPDSQFDYMTDLMKANHSAGIRDWPGVLAQKWRLLANAGGN